MKVRRYFTLLLVAFLTVCLLLVTWTNSAHPQRNEPDYSVLRRTQFQDIIQHDRDKLGQTGNGDPLLHDLKRTDAGIGLDDWDLGARVPDENRENDTEVTSRLRDILRAARDRKPDGFDLSIPKPIPKGNEQIDPKRIIYKSEFDSVRCINSSTFSPLLSEDRYVRNCVTGDVIGETPDTLDTKALEVSNVESVEIGESRKISFQEVYDTRAWGHSWDNAQPGFNASGRGATLAWTQEMMFTLNRVISEIRVRHNLSKVRLLDAPCGDMAWMSRFLQTRDDVQYTGVDIVPDLIQHHRQEYGNNPSMQFIEADLVEVPLNETYDVILSRMLLQHLFFTDVLKVLKRFSDNAKYLLATTFPGVSYNDELDIHKDNMGRFRRLNLETPPISLTAPLCLQRDGPPDAFEGWDHFIGLWKLPLNVHANCTTSSSFVLHGTRQIVYSCAEWSDRING